MTAAVEIFEESGLDAVSMRSVSARLGVSPVPLYSRIGNKEALVDAIADRLLVDLAPPNAAGEPWDRYAVRWARELRTRLRKARDSRLILSAGTRGLRRGVASPGRGHARRRDGGRRRRAGVPPPHVGDRRLRRGRVRRGATTQRPAPDPPRWRPRGCRRRRDRHALRSPHPLHRRRHHERSRGAEGTRLRQNQSKETVDR